MFNIEDFLSLEGYNTDERVSRRKNSKVNSQEFFTPYSIVKRMGDKIPEEDWSNPNKTFCELSFGNGYYDVNDFLNMKNEEILEMNNDHFHGSSMNNDYVTHIHMCHNDHFHGSSMNNDHFHGSSMNRNQF